jgi:dienelactone hydrolase
MKLLQSILPAFILCSIILFSCNNEKDKTTAKEHKLKEETVSYTLDSLSMSSYVVYDENIEGIRPAVLVVHEWWGLNEYAKRRARQLAELGYIAMAVDMYGNGRMGNDPEAAGKLAMPFYQNPQMAKAHFDAALNKFKTFMQVDTGKIAGIGYCFGGGVLLGLARMGEDLKGVVSFHGNLLGTPADKNLLRSKILVCHGDSDSFVLPAEVAQFKKQMDSIGADYTFKTYAGATHSFTNPDATALGQKFKIPVSYNAAADSASWNDMKDFFDRIFK